MRKFDTNITGEQVENKKLRIKNRTWSYKKKKRREKRIKGSKILSNFSPQWQKETTSGYRQTTDDQLLYTFVCQIEIL
jgi:hypothetical protein